MLMAVITSAVPCPRSPVLGGAPGLSSGARPLMPGERGACHLREIAEGGVLTTP